MFGTVAVVTFGVERIGRLMSGSGSGKAYSHTTWVVKAGCEDEFVRRWSEFAEWREAQGFSTRARLYRDIDQPGRFVSFGSWVSLDSIRKWRNLAGFHERLAQLGELADSVEAEALEVVAAYGERRGSS